MRKTSRPAEVHRVVLTDGTALTGTFEEIVLAMRDVDTSLAELPVEQYLAQAAHRGMEQTGFYIPSTDPESFVRASADAGLLRIVR